MLEHMTLGLALFMIVCGILALAAGFCALAAGLALVRVCWKLLRWAIS